MGAVQPDASPAAGETVGERLRRLRLERGFSQRELAAPGVSYAYISRIEAGTRQPSVKALRRLAANLGVTADYLETGSDLDGSAVRELQLAQLELAVRLGERRGVHDALAAVLADSLAAGDNGAASRARVAIAQLALEDGRAQDAVDVLDEPSKGEPFLPGDRVETYVNLGRAYAAVGRTNEAAELFERCLAAVEAERADPALEARYATLLGSALSDTGDIARAEDAVRSALDRVEETGDPYLRVRQYWSAARHAQAEGRESAALSKVRRAVALLEATDDTFHLAR